MVSKVCSGTNYTIYIPENPERLIIYIHARMDFPHSKGRKSKTLYNFQEEVVEGIFNTNPNTIVVAAKYYKGLVPIIEKLIVQKNVKEMIISGWSLGGNDAITLLKALKENWTVSKPNDISLLLIDANHTNQFSDKVYRELDGTSVYYVTNTLSPAKTKHISQIIKNGFSLKYLLLSIPKDFSGSNHRFCRDSVINDNVYGYIFGGTLKDNYKVCHWDPEKGEIVL